MSIMGTKVLRKEDPEFLTRGATYTADFDEPRLAGAAYVTFVRSTIAHGTINSIDTSEAESMPGVLAVLTAADIDNKTLAGAVPLFAPEVFNRPVLASEKVRFVGEPVAIVVTETAVQGEDAIEAVFVDIDPLPAVSDIDSAMTDSSLLFPDLGTNTVVDFAAMGMCTGITDDSFFEGCEAIATTRVVNNKTAAAPLEVRSAAAAWDGDRLVQWMSNQHPHGARDQLVGFYELDPSKVQVIVPDVGGGFGAKINIYPEEAVLGLVAKKVGRPVRWLENRTENLNAMGPGRAQVQTVTIGGNRDGKVLAYRLEILGDCGAYGRLGGFLPFFTISMASGTYNIEKIETVAKSVVTSTTPTEAYRGAGRPEATAAIERAMDIFAAEIGMDPVAVRRRNLIAADAFPFTTATGAVYDSGDYETALDKALEAAGYEELRAEQARRREAGGPVQMGIGVSCYVEVTAGPAPGGEEYGKVEITPDGKAVVHSGSMSHGQSHATTFAMIAADQLGLGIDDIEIVQGDTDLIPKGQGTMASRSTQLGGSAVFESSNKVVDMAREVAAELLEANVDDVVLDTDAGQFHVAGTPAVAKSWAEVATAAGPDGLVAETDFNGNASYPFGAHVVVVDVDTDTGGVVVKRVVTCDDAGTLVNPMIVAGQRHGGIAQGVAQALLEEVRYDEDGNPTTSNFADYGIISMAELPSFELVTMETPSPNNPLGAKGIGESGAIGSTPATQSAVVDAVAHLGVRHIDIPTTAERVWRAIEGAKV